MTQVNPFAAAAPAPQPQAAAAPAAADATNPAAPQPAPQTATTAATNPTSAPAPAGATVPATVAQQGTSVATYSMGSTHSSDVEDVTLDDDIKFDVLEKFPKLKANEKARLAFLVFNDSGSPQLKKVDYFYDKAANAIWNVPKNPEVLKACIAKYGEPKIKFGGIVMHYETDQHGNVLPTNNFKLEAWTFSRDKWPVIQGIHKEWGLANHDLILTCTEPEFQKISIAVARDCLFKAADPNIVREILEKARYLHEKHLPNRLGRQMDDNQIMGIVTGQPMPGAGPAGGPAGLPAGGGVNPFARQAGVGQPASGEFSNLIANGTQTV